MSSVLLFVLALETALGTHSSTSIAALNTSTISFRHDIWGKTLHYGGSGEFVWIDLSIDREHTLSFLDQFAILGRDRFEFFQQVR